MSVHSIHADRLADHHAAIRRALEASSPARVEAVDHAVQVLHELVRDDVCDVYMIVAGVDPEAWDELDGVHVHDGRKREHLRTALGQPIVTIDYVRGEGAA